MKIRTIFLIIPFLLLTMATSSAQGEGVEYYTCGMHPTVKVTVENYNKGETKCPICSMPLTSVNKGESDAKATMGNNVIAQVNIAANELKLAGVQTQKIGYHHLSKEIRTVGRVAYDPKLAVAEEEYLSAYKAYEKIKNSKKKEIADRALRLVESSKRKLRLLGLGEDEIETIIKNDAVETNLILPEEQMWVYGDIYEHEIEWVKEGTIIVAKAVSLPGQEFTGNVSAIDPIVDPMTRAIKFRAKVDNPQQLLKPDMYLDIFIQSHYISNDGEHEVLAIPKEALLDTGKRRIVWVDLGDGGFEGRRVKVGPIAKDFNDDNEYYPVLSGLSKNELVVTKGNFLIDSQSQITGVVASSFGGTLEPVEDKGSMKGSPSEHKH